MCATRSGSEIVNEIVFIEKPGCRQLQQPITKQRLAQYSGKGEYERSEDKSSPMILPKTEICPGRVAARRIVSMALICNAAGASVVPMKALPTSEAEALASFCQACVVCFEDHEFLEVRNVIARIERRETVSPSDAAWCLPLLESYLSSFSFAAGEEMAEEARHEVGDEIADVYLRILACSHRLAA